MIVGICDNNVVLSIDRDPAGLRELSLQDPELPELAVVDHLLPLDLRLGRIQRGHAGHRGGGQVGARQKLRSQVNYITGWLRQTQPILNTDRH